MVKTAARLLGKKQKKPYIQGEIDLSDKNQVEEADRKRFAFVNEIVAGAENRKVLTREKNSQDKIDAVLTNKFAGIPIFAAVMFLVFYISQTTVGTWIADWLVGYIETFQEFCTERLRMQVRFSVPFWQTASSAASVQ